MNSSSCAGLATHSCRSTATSGAVFIRAVFVEHDFSQARITIAQRINLMRHDHFAEIRSAGAGVAEHELEPGLDRVAAAVMETARGFNKKNGAARVAELDGFLSVNDRVNILIADAITTLPAPIVQGPAGLLRNTARKKRPGAMLGGCVPQQHENINKRQRIVIHVVKLAVMRLVWLIIEGGI